MTMSADLRDFLIGARRLPDEGRPDADTLFDRAWRAERAGNLAAAARLYSLVARLDPSDAVSCFNLGNVLRDDGRPLDAMAAWSEALVRDPSLADAAYNMALACARSGDMNAAVRFYRRALAADPRHGASLFNLALALTRQGWFGEALPAWEDFARFHPADPDARAARRHAHWCRIEIETTKHARVQATRDGSACHAGEDEDGRHRHHGCCHDDEGGLAVSTASAHEA